MSALIPPLISALGELQKKYHQFQYESTHRYIVISFFQSSGPCPTIMNIYTDNPEYLHIVNLGTYQHLAQPDDIREPSEILNAIESRFLAIAETLGGATIFSDYRPMAISKLSALDIEINRSRNKLKYMEAQLFASGTPSGKSSGH
jgi:hypothetical protein